MFELALKEGLPIPLTIQYLNSKVLDPKKIGMATIRLSDNRLVVDHIDMEDATEGATLNKEVINQLIKIKDIEFGSSYSIRVVNETSLRLDLKRMNLVLSIDKDALSLAANNTRTTILPPSSVESITGVLDYDLGLSNTYRREGKYHNNANYLSLDNYFSYKEHHLNFNGSLYGSGTKNHNATLYRALYERDVNGFRFATGMMDSWNMQSLSNVSGISGGQIYGFSLGNNASSLKQNNSISLTPIEVFLPSNGEVLLYRDGKLLSIQSYPMGRFEVDTENLPWGLYNVTVAVKVDGKIYSETVQRVNKVFSARSRDFKWQMWGGLLHSSNNYIGAYSTKSKKKIPKDTWLLGASGNNTVQYLNGIGLGTSVYGFDKVGVVEQNINIPFNSVFSYNFQGLGSTDSSWRVINTLNVALPGGVSLWTSQEKGLFKKRLDVYDTDLYSYGGTLNVGAVISGAGSITASYNRDRYNKSNYYNVDYYQHLLSGRYGNLGMRMGMQRYSNNNNSDLGKYISLDFSLPLGNWASLGVSHERRGTIANLNMQKNFDNSAISSVGAELTKNISGQSDERNLVGLGSYLSFDGKYAAGSANINRSANGFLSSNVVARGELGWAGKNLAMGARKQGSGAGVIVNTGLDQGELTAKINGQMHTVGGAQSYLALAPYNTYSFEMMNGKDSKDSFDIIKGKKKTFTLYPGNVAVFNPEIKRMVTVFGRMKMPDGKLLSNVDIKNHIGSTRTDSSGSFSIDVDVNYPVVTSSTNGKACSVTLNLIGAKGVYWAGDITCEPDLAQANIHMGKDYES